MTTRNGILDRVRDAVRGRVRLLLAAGGAFLLLIAGTYAIWSDDVTATTGDFSSGTVAIRLGPDKAENYTLSIDELWPGDTKTATFTVHNTGSLPITYTMTENLTNSTWTQAGRTALKLTITGKSGTLQPGASADATVTATFDASQITAPTGAGSFQAAHGDLNLTFNASNQ